MSTVFKGIAKTETQAKKAIRDAINDAKQKSSISIICKAARGIDFYPMLIACDCGISGGIRGEYISPGGKKYVGYSAICRHCAK
jgi:hypothetical protein